jgi:hypothetical protein
MGELSGHRVNRLHPFRGMFIMFNLKIKAMERNMGSADRIIRLIIAALVVVLYFTGILKGTLGVVLLALAAIMAGTSIIRFCPLYALFGISTCQTKKVKP